VEQSRRSYIRWLALAVTAVAAVLLYPRFSLNHDTSWFLAGTRMFLEGEQLYIGVVDLNPPLVYYLTVPAIWLSNLTWLTDTAAFVAYTIALAVASAIGLAQILRRSLLGSASRDVLFFGSLLGLFVLPYADFGQREHLMLILAMPYLFLLALGDDAGNVPVVHRTAIGIVATLGLALKPHFLLAPALMLLVGPIRLLPRRILDPANLGLAAGLLGYLGLIASFHGQYLTEIVPLARRVYGAYGAGSVQIVLRFELAGLLMLGLLYRWGKRSSDPISLRLLLAALGFYLGYLLQFKGWSYHIIPCSFFLVLGSLRLLHQGSSLRNPGLVPALLAVLVLLSSLGSQIGRGPYVPRTTKPFAKFVDRPGQPILVLSGNVIGGFPFVNEVQGRWASRYPAQWPLPGAFVARSKIDCRKHAAACGGYDEILAKTRKADIEDLLRFAPELVFIDDHKHKGYFEGLQFDYLEFLSADPRFPAIWSRYKYRGRVAAYKVWSKVADKSAAKR
jgi:hypothetical protein